MNRRAGRQTSADPIGTPTSIYVMDVDGSHLTRITTGTGDEGDGKPAYSPNSRRIDFIRNGAIEIVNADGTGIWEIVGPEAHASTPRWSPDGLRILYGDNTDGQSGARIISLRGGAPALVGQISDAGWSPDGSLILGTFWREEMHYVGLATVSPDGEFNPVVLWHPEELKDIFPNSPTWIGT